MATRSTITAVLENGIFSIYCHFDGYIEHNGKILFENYDTQEKVKALVELGDLSVLAPSTESPEGHSYETPVKGYCVAYGRDRGEENTEARKLEFLSYVYEQDYNYAWIDGQWFVDGKLLTDFFVESEK